MNRLRRFVIGLILLVTGCTSAQLSTIHKVASDAQAAVQAVQDNPAAKQAALDALAALAAKHQALAAISSEAATALANDELQKAQGALGVVLGASAPPP